MSIYALSKYRHAFLSQCCMDKKIRRGTQSGGFLRSGSLVGDLTSIMKELDFGSLTILSLKQIGMTVSLKFF